MKKNKKKHILKQDLKYNKKNNITGAFDGYSS